MASIMCYRQKSAADGLMLTTDYKLCTAHSVYNIILITNYMGRTEQNVYSFTSVHTKVNPKQHKISNTCIVL